MNDDGRYRRLRWYNLAMGLVHAAQGVAILLLSNDFALPVTATFMEGPPGTIGELRELFTLPLGPAVAAFLFLSAGAHWIIAAPGVFGWYRDNLGHGRNYARWIEYSLSSSLMIVLIAMITGITDIAALLGLAGVNAAMILFGLLMEHYEQPGRANWMSFWFGSLAGAIPWVAIVIYVWAPGVDAEPPAFVYGIIVSLFLFFNSFALNTAPDRQVGAGLAGVRQHPRSQLTEGPLAGARAPALTSVRRYPSPHGNRLRRGQVRRCRAPGRWSP